MIKVLVVDDSIFMRRVISDAVNAAGDMVVVGTVANGDEVLKQVRDLKPDVITLDIEMPRKNGLIALQEVMTDCPTPVVMCSTLTASGTQATMAALEIGAIDFIAKPTQITAETMKLTFNELIPKIRTAAKARVGRGPSIGSRPVMKAVNSNKVLLIASSTGGPKALMTLFETLPKDMTVPCVIVQHMPVGFTKSLAHRLAGAGSFKVREAEPGDKLEPGLALLAQGGKHLEFESASRVRFNDAPERLGVKPCADYLFESGAKHLGDRTLGVILTGMGKDATQGALAIKQAGGMVLGESAETCTVYGMPRSAKEAGAVDGEFPVHELHLAIMAALQGGKRAAA
jgi:two-component system chemotaxis response regulator CheB